MFQNTIASTEADVQNTMKTPLLPTHVNSGTGRYLATGCWRKKSGSRHNIARSAKMLVVPFDPELAERVRQCLDASEVREVAMFGGRSFMVHDRLAVAASSDGSLLLRCAPDRADELLQRDGARPAEMRGKPMSRGWIRIDIEAVRDDVVLQQWIAIAVAAIRGSPS